jgi:hypothetical protein
MKSKIKLSLDDYFKFLDEYFKLFNFKSIKRKFIIGDNFKWNIIQTGVSSYDFTSATHVYGNYNCFMFSNSLGFVRLSYYNSSDVLVVTDVDA